MNSKHINANAPPGRMKNGNNLILHTKTEEKIMKKRIISILLAVIMVAGMLPLGAIPPLQTRNRRQI